MSGHGSDTVDEDLKVNGSKEKTPLFAGDKDSVSSDTLRYRVPIDESSEETIVSDMKGWYSKKKAR